MTSTMTDKPSVVVERRSLSEQAELANLGNGVVCGTVAALAPAAPAADGRSADSWIHQPAHAPFSFCARDLYEEVRTRLRQRGYHWE